MLVVMSNWSDSYEPILREALQSERNERVQSHMLAGKPLFQRICVTCFGLMLSKNLEMSNRRRAPTFLAALMACIWCIKVAIASMAQCWGREPNWVIGRRACWMMSQLNLLATIFSRSLLMHSSRLIGQ
jgi:hypothetical protein